MKVVTHSSIQSFLTNAEELLLKQESFYNLMLGLAYNVRDNKMIPTDPRFYTLEKNGETIGCALKTSLETPLILTQLPIEAIDLLIKTLIENQAELPGVVSEEVTATYFKDQWIDVKRLSFRVKIHLGVYECFKVIFPANLSGKLITATLDHKDLVREYMIAFMTESFPLETPKVEYIETLLTRLLDNSAMYFLQNDNNEVVSMIANNRSTIRGGVISYVYTPPHLRGKGHASASVALLSDKLLREGKEFTTLFTDLQNPTSNSIYQKVGFVKIAQNIHFDFINP